MSLKKKQLTDLDEIKQLEVDILDYAVSYTHLDVYKRQVKRMPIG